MTNTTQLCSRAFVTTAKSEAPAGEISAGEIPGLLTSIVEGLDKLCAELAILDNAIKKHLAGRTVSKA